MWGGVGGRGVCGEALRHFEAVLDHQSGHLQAPMGKAKV